tara:strand:- start:18905 stop:19120 length:216 start_codon:yes stop_codon:yes gene_type:complete
MSKRWDDVRRDFESLAFKAGVTQTAKAIHVHRATVYRLINQETRKPSGPLRAAVENFVATATTENCKVNKP